jgi:hypothetical protein
MRQRRDPHESERAHGATTRRWQLRACEEDVPPAWWRWHDASVREEERVPDEGADEPGRRRPRTEATSIEFARRAGVRPPSGKGTGKTTMLKIKLEVARGRPARVAAT